MLTELQKAYAIMLAWVKKQYDLQHNPIPMDIVVRNGAVDDNGNLVDVTVKNDAKKKVEFEEWKDSVKGIMSNPYQHTFTVGGDVNTYYPIRLDSGSIEPFIINIRRSYGDKFPASLGTTHVGGLSLTLECVKYNWSDFNYTKIKNFLFSYHHTLARIIKYGLGRIVWLRGGGFEYTIKTNYKIDISPPIMTTTTFIMGGDPNYPYTVSPIGDVDDLFKNTILVDTII